MLRFAPSTTCDLDVGNLRIAIFNHILSKQTGEKLIIRIDDIDNNNHIDGKDKEILELLDLFNINYEYGINQSSNVKNHHKMAMKLLMNKQAFSCFCSDDWLNKQKDEAKKNGEIFSYDGHCETLSDDTVLNTQAPFRIRMKRPSENIAFNDLIKGEIESEPFNVDNFIILNQDKSPTYNYACAIDDMFYDISTIIRDEKHLFDTPRQIYIRKCLGYDKEIKYIHLPKMESKNGLPSVKSLIDNGFLPSAIANYLVLIGTTSPNEIFTLEEATTWFDINKISNEDISFDIEKLKSINNQYLKEIDDLRLSKILGFADEDIGKLGKLFLNEASTIKEIKSKIDLIFSKKETYEEFNEEFLKLKECLQNAPFFNTLEELKKYAQKQTQIEDEKLLKTLEYIITGSKNSNIELDEIYSYVKNYLGEIV